MILKNSVLYAIITAIALCSAPATVLGVGRRVMQQEQTPKSFAYYQERVREFLHYLGCQNPSAVSIVQMSPLYEGYKTAAGYCSGKTIALNMDAFDKQSEAYNLLTCAHECAHYVSNHSYQPWRNELEIEEEADIKAARMLCTHGYEWALKECIKELKYAIKAGIGRPRSDTHPTHIQQVAYFSAILAEKRPNTKAPSEQESKTRIVYGSKEPVSWPYKVEAMMTVAFSAGIALHMIKNHYSAYSFDIFSAVHYKARKLL